MIPVYGRYVYNNTPYDHICILFDQEFGGIEVRTADGDLIDTAVSIETLAETLNNLIY